MALVFILYAAPAILFNKFSQPEIAPCSSYVSRMSRAVRGRESIALSFPIENLTIKLKYIWVYGNSSFPLPYMKTSLIVALGRRKLQILS